MASFPSGSGGVRAACRRQSSLLCSALTPTPLPSSLAPQEPLGTRSSKHKKDRQEPAPGSTADNTVTVHIARAQAALLCPSSSPPAAPANQAGCPQGSSRGRGQEYIPRPGQRGWEGPSPWSGLQSGHWAREAQETQPWQVQGLRAKLCEQRPLVEEAAATAACTQVSQPRLLGRGEQVFPGHLKGGQHSPAPGPGQLCSGQSRV